MKSWWVLAAKGPLDLSPDLSMSNCKARSGCSSSSPIEFWNSPFWSLEAEGCRGVCHGHLQWIQEERFGEWMPFLDESFSRALWMMQSPGPWSEQEISWPCYLSYSGSFSSCFLNNPGLLFGFKWAESLHFVVCSDLSFSTLSNH